MFAYNPTVQNNAGQIYGQYQLQGAQNLAQGIGQASTGISDAIKQINQLNMAGAQAKGTISALKMFEDQVDPDTGKVNKQGLFPAGTSDQMMQAPLLQQIGIAHDVPQLIGSAVLGQYRAGQLAYDKDKLNLLAGKNAIAAGKIQPAYVYTPGQGYSAGTMPATSDASSGADSSTPSPQ